KHSAKPYWEMNAKELAESTKEFDTEFVADKAKRLGPTLRARWVRAKAKRSSGRNSARDEVITVRLESKLLERCTSLARKKRVPRDYLISWGLRAVLAAEAEGD